MKYIIDKCEDTQNTILTHNKFEDLVSSLSVYNSQDKKDTNIEIDSMSDDSDFRFIQEIESYIDLWLDDPTQDMLVPATVPGEYIWSSVSNVDGGYDRTLTINYNACKSFLRQKETGDAKGFCSEDAVMLSVSIRTYRDDDDILHIVFVKNKGNHRYTMKQMVTPNKIASHLCNVKFHSIEKESYNEHEANRHHTEANYKVGQNEKNRVHSGYVARVPEIVEMMSWLKSHEIDFDGIFALTNPEAKNWINIRSVSGINNGIGNGSFKRYGKDNMDIAIESCKDICDITSEKQFTMTALEGHALWYKTWTESHDEKPLPLTKDEMKTYLKQVWNTLNPKIDDKKENRVMQWGDSTSFKLKELAMSGDVKDIPYLLCRIYFKQNISIKSFFKYTRNSPQATGFGSKSPNVDFLLSKTDRLLKNEVRNLILND